MSRTDERIMDESVIAYVSMKDEKLADTIRAKLNVKITCGIVSFYFAYLGDT